MSITLRSELRIPQAKDFAADRIREANRVAAELLLEQANRKVPHDRGDLEASGHIVEGEGGAHAVAYDDPKAKYLVAHPEWQYADGRSGRWLMEALEEGHGDLGDAIVDSIRSGWPG